MVMQALVLCKHIDENKHETDNHYWSGKCMRGEYEPSIRGQDWAAYPGSIYELGLNGTGQLQTCVAGSLLVQCLFNPYFHRIAAASYLPLGPPYLSATPNSLSLLRRMEAGYHKDLIADAGAITENPDLYGGQPAATPTHPHCRAVRHLRPNLWLLGDSDSSPANLKHGSGTSIAPEY
ncbi:hypothetical protein K438DRAFT_1772171 [Mycena galopus ATCC 62051]|nr:hypothetical protein K438DRAFT_1772171 [Mycena galopus ATCC 62051]